MRFRVVFLSVMLLAAAPALAQEVDDALMQDYIGVSKALRVQGIDPAKVRWQPIESACVALKEGNDQVAYNRCRFTKAIDSQLYYSDRTMCRTRSRAQFPDALATRQPDVTIGTQGFASTTITEKPLSWNDLNNKRGAAFDDCMVLRGWRDTQDPLMGRDKN